MSRSEDAAWETGWDGHEVQQLRRLASVTLADKLEWLEEAQRLLRHLSAARQGSAEEDADNPSTTPRRLFR